MKALIGLISLSILAGAATLAFADQPSHYDILKDKYLNHTNNSLTREHLEGGYLGRCYSQGSDDPIGMNLLTRKFVSTSTQDADQGPDFPAVTTTKTTWKMALALRTTNKDGSSDPGSDRADYDPVSSNDNTTAAQADDFWTKGAGRTDPEMQLSEGVASYTIVIDANHGLFVQAKEGTDGLIYLQAAGTPSTPVSHYCYFYKKLF